MKKVLLTVASLLALSMAFVGCNNNTNDESGSETPTKATGTYTINELSIAKNYSWTAAGTKDETTFANWQTIVNLDSSWKLAVEDELTVTFSGKSSKEFKIAKANIVDNTDAANWWTELASKESKDAVFAGSAADDAVATDTFTEVKSTYKIDTAATAAGAAKLVIYIEPESLGYADKSDAYTNGPETIDFTDVTIKVDLNGGSSDSETPSDDSETPTEETKATVSVTDKSLSYTCTLNEWGASGSAQIELPETFTVAEGDVVVIKAEVEFGTPSAGTIVQFYMQDCIGYKAPDYSLIAAYSEGLAGTTKTCEKEWTIPAESAGDWTKVQWCLGWTKEDVADGATCDVTIKSLSLTKK